MTKMQDSTQFFDLSNNYGVLAISGPDAAKFLQGQVTCNVLEVAQTQGCLGAHCDAKGRVQFLFRLFNHQQDYYLILPQSIIAHAITLLKKYAVFSKVKLEDVSQQWTCLGVVGQAEDLPQDKILVKVDDTPRFILIIPSGAKKDWLVNENTDSWKLLDIRAKIPAITLENTDEFTPHDLNLPALNAVSFNKGCYTGQEIVARMHYLGKLKQHLQHVVFSSVNIPLVKTKLCLEDGKVVGRLIDVVKIDNEVEALALIQDSALEQSIYLENSVSVIKII